jgi:Zn-dependent peptidase ImmA (M78 family)
MVFEVYGKKVNVKKVKKLMLTKGASGTYHTKSNIIEVDSSLKGEELIHTYIHELIHALCNRLCLENCDLSHDLEEILADNIPTMLLENFDIKCKRRVG